MVKVPWFLESEGREGEGRKGGRERSPSYQQLARGQYPVDQNSLPTYKVKYIIMGYTKKNL